MRPEIQLPYLETFAKAAELNNFTAAGKELAMTQAAVSQRMHELEKALGTLLFRRTGGRLLLTDEGRRLYDYVQRILELHRQARQEIAGQKTSISGQLRLGASTIPGEHFLPALMSVFRRRYPQIEVRASIGDSLAVINQVEQGRIQLGLVGRKADNPRLEFRHFSTDRMVLVVPAGHTWARRRQISLQQLCKQALILREPGSGSRHCLEMELARREKSLGDMQIALELGSNAAIKEAVGHGLGLAVLSIHAVQQEIKTGQLHVLKVTDLSCDRELFMVWDRQRVLAPPAQVFRIFLESNPIPEAAP